MLCPNYPSLCGCAPRCIPPLPTFDEWFKNNPKRATLLTLVRQRFTEAVKTLDENGAGKFSVELFVPKDIIQSFFQEARYAGWIVKHEREGVFTIEPAPKYVASGDSF